jgi:hypothetical protein
LSLAIPSGFRECVIAGASLKRCMVESKLEAEGEKMRLKYDDQM